MVYCKLCIYVNWKEQMAHFLDHFSRVLVSRTATANSVSPKVFQGHRLTHGAGHTLGQRLKIHGINKNELHVIHFAELSFCILCSGDFAILRCSFWILLTQFEEHLMFKAWQSKATTPTATSTKRSGPHGKMADGKWLGSFNCAALATRSTGAKWSWGRQHCGDAGWSQNTKLWYFLQFFSRGLFPLFLLSKESKLSFGSERLTRDFFELLIRFT